MDPDNGHLWRHRFAMPYRGLAGPRPPTRSLPPATRRIGVCTRAGLSLGVKSDRARSHTPAGIGAGRELGLLIAVAEPHGWGPAPRARRDPTALGVVRSQRPRPVSNRLSGAAVPFSAPNGAPFNGPAIAPIMVAEAAAAPGQDPFGAHEGERGADGGDPVDNPCQIPLREGGQVTSLRFR